MDSSQSEAMSLLPGRVEVQGPHSLCFDRMDDTRQSQCLHRKANTSGRGTLDEGHSITRRVIFTVT